MWVLEMATQRVEPGHVGTWRNGLFCVVTVEHGLVEHYRYSYLVS